MKTKIVMGPILGFEGNGRYTALVVVTGPIEKMVWAVDGKMTAFEKIAELHNGVALRAEFKVPPVKKPRACEYSVQCGGEAMHNTAAESSWSFWLPGDADPKIAYCSCNGFSSLKLLKDTPKPYALWERMGDQHKKAPYSLLLMGGDQIYADSIWEYGGPPSLQDWSQLDQEKRDVKAASETMLEEINEFYERTYVKRWSNPPLAKVFARIPTVMMWDDHDIFDGWGSYPDELQRTPVFQAIFGKARRAFEIFQLRGLEKNRSIISPDSAFTMSVDLGPHRILVLDNRSQRTQTMIMSETHWDAVKAELEATLGPKQKSLLVMTAVPVVYRSFALIENMFAMSKKFEAEEDDVLDHWSAERHRQERDKFIHVILDALARAKGSRAVLLSGDVHVAGVGMVHDSRRDLKIYQVIASGIVHPPPTLLQWLGLKALTSDEPEPIGDGDVVLEMLKASGAAEIIRDRNFARISVSEDGKMWINWECEETKVIPSFTIVPKI
jgi:hypothetical protein